MSQHILTFNQSGLFEIQLNRADKLNALTDQMYADLVDAINEAESDETVKVLLLRSVSEHFSAGNDLKDFLENPFSLESNVVVFLKALANFSKPVVAAVSGAAVGIGSTMLLHCDLVYAANNLKASVPFIKLGLTPEGASSVLLAKRCGELKANELLLTGRTMLAEEALSCGFVNALFDSPEALWDESKKVAEKIAKSSLPLLKQTKALLGGANNQQTVALIDKEGLIFADRLESDEAKSAFNAFLNK